MYSCNVFELTLNYLVRYRYFEKIKSIIQHFKALKETIYLKVEAADTADSILKIESAHTKDTPRGSTARMSLEDSERAKSGQYIRALEEF